MSFDREYILRGDFKLNMFDEVKEKVLLRNFVQGEKTIKGNRIRVNPCPLCGGHDCFDIFSFMSP